jgi:nucleotidyltransferase substrate binding protein (TIGR01987 family)
MNEPKIDRLTDDQDIRCIQRFSNYKKALGQLSKFIEQESLNKLETLGLIHTFEYTHELAWNTLKDFLESRGTRDIYGSKDATRHAFRLTIIDEGDVWMNMIQSRNMTSHSYNEETVAEISADILKHYYPAFTELAKKLEALATAEQG